MYSPTHVWPDVSSVYPSTQAVSHLSFPCVPQPLSVVQCVSHTEWMRQVYDISQVVTLMANIQQSTQDSHVFNSVSSKTE